MTSNIKISGICNMQNPATSCIGNIQILHRTGKSVYASWEMHIEDGISLAGTSKNYFINKENASDQEVISFIIENVMNYKIGRKRIFTEIQVINE